MSDTHGFLDDKVFQHFAEVDEIWHAGDIGNLALMEALEAFRPVRAVYGNIDEPAIRHRYPENQLFEAAGARVFMTHIGGYPGRYTMRVKALLDDFKPHLYICGHSHILKIMPDKQRNLLHINPGACGQQGLHKIKTLVRLSITAGQFHDVQVIELGLRGR